MAVWMVVAACGAVLSLTGLTVLVGQYRKGRISRRYLLAIVVGFASLASYALISALWPELGSGLISLLILSPGFIAIVILIHERQVTGHS